MSHENDPRPLLQSWTNTLKEALNFDAWGQRLEAADVYQSLTKLLKNYSGKNHTLFTDNQKKTLEKIALCLASRSKALQTNAFSTTDVISIHDLRQLEHTLHNLLGESSLESSRKLPNHMSLTSAELQNPHQISNSALTPTHEKISPCKGTFLPRTLSTSGQTMLTITIEQIALKNAMKYLEPFVSVSVKDSSGKTLSAAQDIPTVAVNTENSVIFFNSRVHMKKPVESYPAGFAVFFEFKHLKPKKSIVSTKCWAVMEADEIKEGALALEIYKKPTDYCRKTLKLLTTKPMYLYLQLSLS